LWRFPTSPPFLLNHSFSSQFAAQPDKFPADVFTEAVFLRVLCCVLARSVRLSISVQTFETKTMTSFPPKWYATSVFVRHAEICTPQKHPSFKPFHV